MIIYYKIHYHLVKLFQFLFFFFFNEMYIISHHITSNSYDFLSENQFSASSLRSVNGKNDFLRLHTWWGFFSPPQLPAQFLLVILQEAAARQEKCVCFLKTVSTGGVKVKLPNLKNFSSDIKHLTNQVTCWRTVLLVSSYDKMYEKCSKSWNVTENNSM